MSETASPNPYSPFLPVSDSRMFFGLEEEMNEVISGLSLDKSVSFAIIGGRRIGKTSFLLELKRHMLRVIPKNIVWTPIYISLQEITPHTTRQFFESLSKKVLESVRVASDNDNSNNYAIFRRRSETTAFSDFTQFLVALLEDLRKNLGFVRLAFLIDEIAVIAGREWITDVSENLRFLLSNHPIRQSLSLVVSSPIQLHRLFEERGSPLNNILSKVFLRVLNDSEVRALITKPSARLSLASSVVDEMIKYTGGHPHLTQYIMWSIFQKPRKTKVSTKDIGRIAHNYLEKQYEQFWNWSKYLRREDKKVLSLLLRTDETLSERDISSRAPRIDIHDSLRALRFMGMVAKTDKGFRIGGEIMRTGLQRLVLSEERYYPVDKYEALMKPLSVSMASNVSNLLRQLNSCPRGSEGAQEFEQAVRNILAYMFAPPLGAPLEQSRTETGLHIRDLIFDIPYNTSGFWQYIQDRFEASALIVECKNYSSPIRGNQVVIPSKYLGRKRLGGFGIIMSRFPSTESAKKEMERLWIEEGKLILCFCDDDLVRMLKLKESGSEPEIQIDNTIHEFFRSLE